jgi:radical SAM-linked protein
MLMAIMRSRFYKKDEMVFVSHLDLIRIFERAIRRANIPVAYTQGFNPHPIMAFATALGVGVASEGEYIDIQLTDNMNGELFMDKLNDVLPEGLKIIESRIIADKAKSLMSIICSSTYLVKLKAKELLNEADIKQCIENLLDREEIIEVKQKRQRRGRRSSDSGFKQINIRPLIKNIELANSKSETTVLSANLTILFLTAVPTNTNRPTNTNIITNTIAFFIPCPPHVL